MSVHGPERARERRSSLRTIECALWVATGIVVVVLALGRVRESRATAVPSRPAAMPGAPSTVDVIAPESLAAAVDVARDGNLFRRDRQPADPAAQLPGTAAPGVPQPPAPPKPRPILRGLLGGPPWEAVLEGVPGREGSVVVRVGESVGGLTVRAVRHDTVMVLGADTSWKLTLRRP